MRAYLLILSFIMFLRDWKDFQVKKDKSAKE